MTIHLRQMDAEQADRENRLRSALFLSMGVEGVYARSALFEDVLERLNVLITSYRESGTEVLRFPPVMSRSHLERGGYLKSFPNLIGCACALHGTESEIRAAAEVPNAGWVSHLHPTELVLCPAACYPLYPIVAARGPMPPGETTFDVASDCFRREPSADLDRMQTFRMREFVCFGSAQDISRFRERWIANAALLADRLVLPYRIEQASDPFFGRIGQMKAVAQLQAALKFELLVPLHSDIRPTACMSFNVHRDHFGSAWAITDEAGNHVQTGCVAFGMDRLALSLFWTHGLDPAEWPHSAKSSLRF